ncbi:MAG: alpha-L-arabinofuranosidase [Verrucomicrobiales bacterium]|nr:alpha-L-arabinofuranosidase [Verrucomicrobiales bacterium]
MKHRGFAQSQNCLLVAALTALTLCHVAVVGAASVQLTVRVDEPGARINPAMWGVFFEDINFGADGGLYAELVKNRGFEFPDALMGWSMLSPSKARGKISVRDDDPFNAKNPHYLRMESAGTDLFGVANEGFRGIGVKRGEAYKISLQIRNVSGSPGLRIELYSSNGALLDSVRLNGFSRGWEERTAVLMPRETDPGARLYLLVDGRGAVDVDFVSLFPGDTWKHRPGGLRADMVQALADLKPGFLRFPGGCIVEGSELDKRYQWKHTIGPVAERPLLINRWNYEFLHRPAPDYFQSFGLGFFEYFQLSEDIGAEPLPILNCGMACQFNSGQLVPLDELDPFIQDALDLIEFANGPATSEWGARRAALGHPEPFHLKLLGVGNEQWGPQYIERYAAFARVIKEKHPGIQLVSGAGPSPADERYDFLWPRLRELHADIVDEHCYANPIWFLSNAHRYDDFDPQGPKVFFGEYAAQSDKIVSVENRNNWECALSEAAFLTGVERNADVVTMASYAPLFAHVDAWQWTPDLIWVDNLRTLRTANYHVQQQFMHHRGDVVLPVVLSGDPAPSVATGGVRLTTYNGSAEFRNVVVTAGGATLINRETAREGDRFGDASWSDYTIRLQARKTGGREGFIIAVRERHPNTWVQWNLGGWNNTKHGIQSTLGVQESLIAQVPGHIDAGRWYEVKIVLTGPRMDCFLDGELVQSVDVPLPRTEGVFASAVRDETAGEVILKVANVHPKATPLDIALEGVRKPAGPASVTTLRGGLKDVNTFDEPEKIAPVVGLEECGGARFQREFPANSFTVIRLKTER